MKTHTVKTLTRTRRPRTMAAALAACVTVGLFAAPTAATASPLPVPASPIPFVAAPDEPSTSDEAQQAYLRANERAALLNEQTLVAQEREQATRADAARAAQTLLDRTAAADTARTELSAAQSVQRAASSRERAATTRLAEHQALVDDFADAAFRGGRTGTMTALFTADSPEDFLDTAATLDVVADDTRQTLDDAATARQQAVTARSDAEQAAAAARTAAQNADAATRAAADAKTNADAAQKTAQQAATDLTQRRAGLQAEVRRYAELRDQLTEQEREAAFRAAAEERERAAQLAAERARADRANREPIATAAAPTPAADGQTPAPSAAAAEPAPEPAPVEDAPPAAQAAVQAALSKVGSRYVWGASGPDSFDCSGLTSWAYAQAGVTIPRTSGGQSGLPVVSLDALQPGDLITYYSPVSHVAMYIGNGQIVHASTASKPVYVSSVYYGGDNPVAHRAVG